MPFLDRADAGRHLAKALSDHKREKPIILALPRGGVPVAAEIARALDAPLDLVLVRKIGVPYQPELAMGAVVDGPNPVTVRNEDIIRQAGVSEADFAAVRDRELAEIRRRRDRYLAGRAHPHLKGRVVIVIDDGVATGATTRAALRAVRRQNPSRLILAIPVASADVLHALRGEADDVVCLEDHEPFGAVGSYYANFGQVTDEEVAGMLAGSPVEHSTTTAAPTT